MNPAWTELDRRATLIARENFLRIEPKDRLPFEAYVSRAYEYVRTNEYPVIEKKVLFH